MKKRIVFKIDKTLSDAFDAIALREHRSRSNLLEMLIAQLLDVDSERQRIRKLLEGYTSEEVKHV